MVKRVVAGPGDHIACCTDGAMTRNGVPVPAHGPGGEGLDQRFEEALAARGLPYVVRGAARFFDRAEVRGG